MTKIYYDKHSKLLMPWNPADMTPQQRANWVLIESVLSSEYERGFKKGLEVGRAEKKEMLDIPRPVL